MSEPPERDSNQVGSGPPLDDDSEPAVLGAAPTLEFRRETRAERAERRRAEREMSRQRSARADQRSAEHSHTAHTSMAAAGAASSVEYVFEPARTDVPKLKEYVEALWERREFMKELARADLKRRHASTALGAIWSILEPMFQVGIYYLLFTIIRRGARPIEFLPALIAGVFLFQLVTNAMAEGGNSIQRSSNLMLSSTFPRALLPLSAVYKGLLKFMPTVGVLVVAFLLLGVHLGPLLALLPLLFVCEMVMCVGFALLLGTLTVYVADASNALRYVIRVLFFTTPIIYPLVLLPPNLESILRWQPLFGLFACFQSAILGETIDPLWLILAAAWAIVLFVAGAWVFLRHESDFARHL